jgi:hypothetical protein
VPPPPSIIGDVEAQVWTLIAILGAFGMGALVLLATLHVRFDGVYQRFDRMDRRFERIDDRFDRIDDRFDRIEEALREIRDEVRSLRERFEAHEQAHSA